MKPYFAKYLPVEDKDSSNTWQWDNNVKNTGWELISPSDMDAIIAHGLNPAPKFRKIRLFLCRRDIQVGDTVQHREGYNKTSEVDWEIIKQAEDKDKFTCKYDEIIKDLFKWNLFKTIGKISSEAIWIKDGDEFEEDEIKIIYTKKYECLCEKPGIYRTPEQATCSHMVDDHRGGDFCIRKIDVVKHVEIMCRCCETFK